MSARTETVAVTVTFPDRRLLVREQRVVGGIAPEQYYTHLSSACLKCNLLQQLEAFYLRVDNALYRNSIFLLLGTLG